MAENPNAAIHIGQLNLRLPAGSAETGNRVANAIGQGLAHRVPPGMRRHLAALSARVQVPAGATETEISAAVAEKIIRSLQK